MRKLAVFTPILGILGLPLLLGITLPLLATPSVAAEPAAGAATVEGPPGMQAMLALKCNLCHSIERFGIERKSKSEKTKGPDLSEIGSAHDAAWLVKWLHKEVDNANGHRHEKDFKGTPEQLAQITQWLASLKKQ
jgi:mono/diheme cytochrome c family protein